MTNKATLIKQKNGKYTVAVDKSISFSPKGMNKNLSKEDAEKLIRRLYLTEKDRKTVRESNLEVICDGFGKFELRSNKLTRAQAELYLRLLSNMESNA